MTVRNERLLNRSIQQIGAFAIVNKDVSTHRLFFIMQKYPTSARGWVIRGDWKILLTHERLLSGHRSVSGPFAVANKKQNVRWSERSPVVRIPVHEGDCVNSVEPILPA